MTTKSKAKAQPAISLDAEAKRKAGVKYMTGKAEPVKKPIPKAVEEATIESGLFDLDKMPVLAKAIDDALAAEGTATKTNNVMIDEMYAAQIREHHLKGENRCTLLYNQLVEKRLAYIGGNVVLTAHIAEAKGTKMVQGRTMTQWRNDASGWVGNIAKALAARIVDESGEVKRKPKAPSFLTYNQLQTAIKRCEKSEDFGQLAKGKTVGEFKTALEALISEFYNKKAPQEFLSE